MLNWHDWAVYCAGRMELKQPTLQPKCITLEDTGESEVLLLSSPYALTTIALEIPVITRLGLKSSLRIGGIHRRLSLIKQENY